MAFVVGVFQLEAFWLDKIELNSGYLVLSSQGILADKINFGPIKGRFALGFKEVQTVIDR